MILNQQVATGKCRLQEQSAHGSGRQVIHMVLRWTGTQRICHWAAAHRIELNKKRCLPKNMIYCTGRKNDSELPPRCSGPPQQSRVLIKLLCGDFVHPPGRLIHLSLQLILSQCAAVPCSDLVASSCGTHRSSDHPNLCSAVCQYLVLL